MKKCFINHQSGLAMVLALVGALVFQAAVPAMADISIKEVPDYVEDLTIGGGTELYLMALQQNAMGIDENNYNWVDGHFKLHLTLKLKSNVEFKFGMVSSGTFGEDYYGIGNEDTSDFDMDDAYIKFNSLFNAPVDLTLGRQRINVEKGFLMSEGNLDYATAVYANSEKASPFAIRVDVDLKPVTLLAYWETIAADDQWAAFGKGDDIEAAGIDAHMDLAEGKSVYLGAVRWLATLNASASKQELMTYYVGTDLTFGPINFTGEYALQNGDNISSGASEVSQDASAYFGFLKYSMDNAPLKPWFEVGTMYFSGDDAGTTDNEGFNTMTLGFPDWGKYSPGEILGEQVYFGVSNIVDYTAQIGILPTETTQVRLQYHNVSLVEDGGYADSKLYDEYNLYVEYFPNDNLYCGIMIGVADPDTAHEEYMGMTPGSSETAIGIMPFMAYTF